MSLNAKTIKTNLFDLYDNSNNIYYECQPEINIFKNDINQFKIKEIIGAIKLYFYVDGKLVYVTKSLPKFNFHALNEMYEKQESVPFNISLGGGTQGLAETVLPNYMLEPTRVYPLEENFAGTFIGYIKSFKFYNCGMEYMNILNNYRYEIKNI